MESDFKASLAELVGTFTLVFIGAGAGAVSGVSGGIVGVALAHGVALMVIIYAWGSISGAHVNPAVTFGVALAGRMTWTRAIYYWAAQFLGALIAAYLLVWILDPVLGVGETTGTLTIPAAIDKDTGAIMRLLTVEAVLTFFLVVAVFASGVQGRNGNLAGVAIGLVLTMDILAGGPLTGASMNPARTFGPAIAAHDYTYLWMYFVGPLVGGAAGALLYDRVFLPARLQPPLEAADDRGRTNRR